MFHYIYYYYKKIISFFQIQKKIEYKIDEIIEI